ncbi:MAG: magnesium/cobalt transporter CorA [bacterium]|nr:magnesium/cobalt transporter CorA [bacterium]
MFKKRNPQIGAPPGTLVFRSQAVPARVQIVRYSSQHLDMIPQATLDDIFAPENANELLWIDVAGIDDPEVLRAGGKRFGLSDLMMENIVNVPQRPKADIVDDKLLFIAHVLKLAPDGSLDIDQLSLVLGKNYVITVHSQPSDFLDPIRQRLQAPTSRMRTRGPDYLAYSVIDSIVDGYYPVLESLGERLERLEDEALENPQAQVLKSIHRLRSQLIQVRRSSWPMREALDVMLRSDMPGIHEDTKTFLRDAHSHCAQTVDVVEMYRESAGALVSTYMSSVAHGSNEIMKVLTMVSSIFVPMTFIAGIYGMNFENMPELSHPWSYPVALSAMAICAAAMLLYFLRRGWFGPISLSAGSTEEYLEMRTERASTHTRTLEKLPKSDREAGVVPSVLSMHRDSTQDSETVPTRPRRSKAA